MKGATLLLMAAATLLCARPARADLPGFLRSENGEVKSGNDALTKGDAKGALESYNHAAHKLPDAPGVQLDRGLALLKQGEYAKAREALLSATQPNAPIDLRADAYRDLSLSFYREADGLATQDKHDEAQKQFREAVDAAKRSLRLRPADADTAWNLELAARRIREEEQKQKDEDDKKKQDQKDQNKDKDKQDPSGGDQNQDQKDKQSDSDQKQDQGDKGDKADKPKPEDKKPEPKPEDNKPEPKPKPDQNPSPQAPGEEEKQKAQPLPREAEQALDSLEGGEENFERYRARQRAARERRAPEKDW
jgi:Ca-activated chloride channel family protein